MRVSENTGSFLIFSAYLLALLQVGTIRRKLDGTQRNYGKS
jgi:hypothetical protein